MYRTYKSYFPIFLIFLSYFFIIGFGRFEMRINSGSLGIFFC